MYAAYQHETQMDIHRWLNDTAYGAAPESPKQNDPLPTRQDTNLSVQPAQRRRWKRARAKRSSSIIVPNKSYGNDAGVRHKRLSSSDHAPGINVRLCRSSFQAGRSTTPSAQKRSRRARKTFKRQPRHKTKPDKYDPKISKNSGRNQGDREVKKSTKRRERHRGTAGARTADLVQSFQLTNRPKASRLTLRPDSSAGLFKHGRASAQLKSCGRGLPDLVFNEMKFLKQPWEHQDEEPHAAQSAKTKRGRRPEEDVPAYFDEHRAPEQQPALVSRKEQELRSRGPVEIAAAGEALPERGDSRALQTAHSRRDNFLGNSIQTRSHRPLSKDGDATTCFSWSKSTESRHDNTRVRLRPLGSLDARARPASSASDRVDGGVKSGIEASQAAARNRNVHVTGHLKDQQPCDHNHSDLLHDLPEIVKEFTSQSLPHLHQHQMAALPTRHPDSRLNDQGWKTSDILNVNDTIVGNDNSQDIEKLKSIDLNEPSSWTKLLGQAQSAMKGCLPAMDEQHNTENHPALQMVNERRGERGLVESQDGGMCKIYRPRDTAMPTPPRVQECGLSQIHCDQYLDRGEPFDTYRTETAEPRMRIFESSPRGAIRFNLESEAMLLEHDHISHHYDDAITNASAERYDRPWSRYDLQEIGIEMQYQDYEGVTASPMYSIGQQPLLLSGVTDIGAVQVASSVGGGTSGALLTSPTMDPNVIKAPDMDEVDGLNSFWRPQKLY